MSLSDACKKNIITILTILLILAIGYAIYVQCWSDRAKLIKLLNKQIQEKEKLIEQLKKQLVDLEVKEKEKLEQIDELQKQINVLQDKITEGEVNIDEIKRSITTIDSSLSIIKEYTNNYIDQLSGFINADSMGSER